MNTEEEDVVLFCVCPVLYSFLVICVGFFWTVDGNLYYYYNYFRFLICICVTGFTLCSKPDGSTIGLHKIETR